MSCFCCQTDKTALVYEYEKKCLFVETTHGQTYVEIYSPFNRANATNEPKEPSGLHLMVHGLGGCVNHWAQSEIPCMLASRNMVVVCFDLYTHGKSESVNNKEIVHDLDLYLNQLQDVIHHPELPFLNAKEFSLQGFSFGGFIILNYLAKYHSKIGQSCCDSGHCIPKVIFQSPWHGTLPLPVKGLIAIPGLLRLCRPSDMKDIKSIKALKEILLRVNKKDNFYTRLNDLVQGIKENQEAFADDPQKAKYSAQKILCIAGTRELIFTWNAQKIYQQTTTDAKVTGNRLRLCRRAYHMSFAHKCMLPQGFFFRNEIEGFLCPELDHELVVKV